MPDHLVWRIAIGYSFGLTVPTPAPSYLPPAPKLLRAQSSNSNNDPAQPRPDYTYQAHHQYTRPCQPCNLQLRSHHHSSEQG